jgi:ribose transport system substrate-binding protein
VKTCRLLAILAILMLLGAVIPSAALAVPPAQEPEMVDTTEYQKEGPYKIGFSNISVVNSWRVQMVEELKHEAALHPEVAELYITDAGGDINKQIADIEDLLAKGIDALLVTPASPTALVPVIEEAYESGIPVIVFNSALDGDQMNH